MAAQERAGSAWSVRGVMWLGFIGVLILVGGFGTWAVTTQIAGAVIASGQIEVDVNRQAIQHPDGGVVAELVVEEGQRVEEGDVLLRLDRSDAVSAFAIASARLNEIQARRARLEAERDQEAEVVFSEALLAAAAEDPELDEVLQGQLDLFAARSETLTQEVDQLTRRKGQITNQIVGLRAQREALTRQQDLIAEELVAQQDLLARGLAQSGRVLSLQREEANLLGAVGEIDANIAQSEERITEIDLAILQRETERREEAIAQLREVRVQEEELIERVEVATRQLDRMDLRAPVSGVVHGLNVFGPQSVVRPAEPVLYLVPQDRPLVISARIAAIHIDQLSVAQEVILRFPVFDARNTPDMFGLVTRVSADVFEDEMTGQQFYEVQIIIDDGELEKLGGQALLPGMPVEAFIRTEDRTPIAYLMRPLTDYFNRAFRES